MMVIHFDTQSESFTLENVMEATKVLQEKYPNETFVVLPDYCNLKKDIGLEYLIQYRDMLNEIIEEKEEN